MDETLEYADADFSLERLAELVGSNSKYVSQAVNEHYGKNFSSFVTDYRIRLACRRLADDEAYGAYTIEGVGRSVGYRSKTTFTAAFPPRHRADAFGLAQAGARTPFGHSRRSRCT